MSTKTVYISIGNSDDKLTQAEWAEFYAATNFAIRDDAHVVHGQWLSGPVSPWQNACWCVEVPDRNAFRLRQRLADLAHTYRQGSIAWAEATTEFIGPAS